MKDNNKTLIVVALIAIAIFGYYNYAQTGSILPGADVDVDIEEPLDLSQSGAQGRGLSILFRNAQGQIIEAPAWFTEAATSAFPAFTVVGPSPWGVACTSRTECTGYDTIAEVQCIHIESEGGKRCVLSGLTGLFVAVNVENPIASGTTYTNVRVTETDVSGDTSGSIFSYTNTIASIAPADGVWVPIISDEITSGIMTGWEGSSKAFTVNEVTAYNEFAEQDETSGPTNTVTLQFVTEPVGGFNVAIVSPITGTPA